MTDDRPIAEREGAELTTSGIILAFVGVPLMIYTAFFFSTSVPGPTEFGIEQVTNLQRVQMQSLMFQTGVAILIISTILISAGSIVYAIARPKPNSPPS